jgi:transposase
LSQSDLWRGLQREVSGRSIEVYELKSDLVRHDVTTVNGHHLVSEAGLFQFGHSKDDPTLPQVKIMVSNLDPLGLPLVTRTVSGERADAIQAEIDQSGWWPYVSNAPPQKLSSQDTVLTYRDEWRVEQGFRHLKGKQLSITPLFVQNDDQVVGLFNLLSIALI